MQRITIEKGEAKRKLKENPIANLVNEINQIELVKLFECKSVLFSISVHSIWNE